MPRRRLPHRHEVKYLPFDPSTPFDKQRALYLRLSDDDPDTVSIEHQRTAGFTLAEQHGQTIVAIYTDWRTGVDPDRLAMAQLVKDAHAGKHPGVIFYDDTRFHRDISGCFPVVKLHAQLPAYTYTACRGVYDIDMVGMHATMSGAERKNTRRRSMEQRVTRARNGQWMAGMKPYWLQRNPDTRVAEIDSGRAAAFLHALQLYAAPNGSAREAAAWLTENAPLAVRRNAPRVWTSQRFRAMLRNPALWGELPYARGMDVKDTVEGQWAMIIRKRIDNPHCVPFTVPPIIHKSELERTQCRAEGGCERDAYPAGTTLDALIKERDGKAGGRPYDIDHPLRHIVLLCTCGWRVRWHVRRSGERSYVYVACAARMASGRSTHNHKPCGMQNMPVNPSRPRRQGGGKPSRTGAVWPKVRGKLIDALRDPIALAEDQRRQVLAEQEIETRSLAEETRLLEELDATLDDLSARENRLYERLDRNVISQNVYDTQTAIIGNERRATEERKRHLLAQQQIIQRAEQASIDLRTALRRLSQIDPSLFSDNQWSQILPDLVESISLDLDGEPAIRWHRPS